VHETVGDVAHRYLDLVDEALPGRVTGLYLVGSVALDDYRPGGSDVDFLAVTDEALTEDDLPVVGAVHETLTEGTPIPAFEGSYVTWAQLAADPAGIEVALTHHDREVTAAGSPSPVQWHTLAAHPVAVRGPEAPEVWTDGDALRRWVRANVDDYWAGWVARVHKLMGRGTMLLGDWAVGWGVLGIPRLHYTLATGEVTSKSAAGEYALATFADEWAPVITEALRLRRGEGEQAEGYRRRPLTRRRDALAFMDHVLADIAERFPPEAPGPS
jgi:hypothetical protein